MPSEVVLDDFRFSDSVLSFLLVFVITQRFVEVLEEGLGVRLYVLNRLNGTRVTVGNQQAFFSWLLVEFVEVEVQARLAESNPLLARRHLVDGVRFV